MSAGASAAAAAASSAAAAAVAAAASGPAAAAGRNNAHVPSELERLVKPHVESFNFFLSDGLALGVGGLVPAVLDEQRDAGVGETRFWIERAHVASPSLGAASDKFDARVLPNECRERAVTYEGALSVDLCWQVGESAVQSMSVGLGHMPIMVKSARCHLRGLSPAQLVGSKEEAHELGGYFVLNGIERIIRLLIVPRRNHVFAIERPSYTNRGDTYTQYGTTIRCVRPDQSSLSLTLHYLTTGSCRLRFTMRKQEFFVSPILLFRALTGATDREIYEQLVQGDAIGNRFLADRVEIMIRESKGLRLVTQDDALCYLGSQFRIIMRLPSSMSDRDAGKELLRRQLFVHCHVGSDVEQNTDKARVLALMVRKLYSLVKGAIRPENPDALSCQEILLPGHLLSAFVKEKLQDWLDDLPKMVIKDLRRKHAVDLSSAGYVRRIVGFNRDVGKRIHYLLVTGNLRSQTGLDLMQTSGFTIVADKLNYFRYLSHFRSVHRGQFFTTMKTTAVRKLLPDSWGFLCPVHTPDGTPCGLLNHMAAYCEVLTHNLPLHRNELIQFLGSLGMNAPNALHKGALPVTLDGVVIGRLPPKAALQFVTQLRHAKVVGHPMVPATLEVSCVAGLVDDGCFPGVFMHTAPGRLTRPVRNLQVLGDRKRRKAAKASTACVEWIGPMEQVFMEVAVTEDDFRPGQTTHMEISPCHMLSLIASLTPFSDFNQSPRNMYQCQMGKQTMGTPFHSLPHRTDNKVYRLQTPQTPIVRTKLYDEFSMDEYPLGMNAIVAVISYTGYDMEDAMIVNKGAYERGLAHASVYKNKFVDLADQRQHGEPIHHRFQKEPHAGREQAHLDEHGLPEIGSYVNPGDALYSVNDDTTHKYNVKNHKDTEPAYVEEVRVLGTNDEELQRVGLKLRINRNPVIGDKFSSRHGQKGVLSRLWPQEDMPFSESGISPDIIINPHAFPSRMTIGMLIESMAGKAGCLHGLYQDSTPFQFDEDNRAVDFFGKQLLAAGYNYHGTETMYSGTTGVEMRVQIFLGVVYYQRLRHMVSDKSQVRALGPVNQTTHQPVKGRKVHGGIRFGEMERDSLLAHGTPFLLHDRLMLCSDYHTGSVCSQCGSILSTLTPVGDAPKPCRNCNTDKDCVTVAMPYIFTNLANELAAMNIRLTLDVQGHS